MLEARKSLNVPMAVCAATACLLAAAPAASAEADGSAHAWLTSGTPLTGTLNAWAWQEQSDAPSPLTVTATIAVAGQTIAVSAPVQTPALTEFQAAAVRIVVPGDVLTRARAAARRSGVRDADVTLTARSAGNPTGDEDWFPPRSSRTSIRMPLLTGAVVRRQRLSVFTFDVPGGWRRVRMTRSGLVTFAAAAAGDRCAAVVQTTTSARTRTPDPRSGLGNAKVVRAGSAKSGARYAIGVLAGGVPRLVGGVAPDAAPLVRAVVTVRYMRGLRRLTLDARPDAGCTASRAGTAALTAALERAIRTVRVAR